MTLSSPCQSAPTIRCRRIEGQQEGLLIGSRVQTHWEAHKGATHSFRSSYSRCIPCNSFYMSFFILKPPSGSGFRPLELRSKEDLLKGLLMKIYSTENSEEPGNIRYIVEPQADNWQQSRQHGGNKAATFLSGWSCFESTPCLLIRRGSHWGCVGHISFH